MSHINITATMNNTLDVVADVSDTIVTDLIAMLSDVAATLRTVKANNLSMPLVCAGGHDPARFVRWGPSFVCCACGRRAQPADQLHTLLARALRVRVQVVEEEAA